MMAIPTFTKRTRFVVTLIILTVGVRCLPASVFVGAADIYNWYVTAVMIDEGQALQIYDTGYVNWPPLMMLPNILVLWLSRLTGFSYFTLFKWPSILADAAISSLIFSILLEEEKSNSKAFLGGLTYAFSPVSILITSVHGQVDAVLILFSLLGWYFYRHNKVNLSGLFLGLGVATKTVAALLIPPFLSRIRDTKSRLLYVAEGVLPALILTLPFFLATPESVTKYAVQYSSRFGSWGLTLIFSIMEKRVSWMEVAKVFYITCGKYLLVISVLLFYWRKGLKLPIMSSLLSVFALFYLLTPGFGYQYLLWIVPFAVIEGRFPLFYYQLFSSLWLLICYLPFMSPLLAGRLVSLMGEQLYWRLAVAFSILTWGVCGIWFISTHFLSGWRFLSSWRWRD